MQRPLSNGRRMCPDITLASLQTFALEFPSKSTSSNASAEWYEGCTPNGAARL
jgi:hypothetical protein